MYITPSIILFYHIALHESWESIEIGVLVSVAHLFFVSLSFLYRGYFCERGFFVLRLLGSPLKKVWPTMIGYRHGGTLRISAKVRRRSATERLSFDCGQCAVPPFLRR